MKLLSTNFFRAASLALALPILGFSAAVQINGICVDGNCVTPAPVAYSPGNVQTGSTNNTLTLGASSDLYRFASSYAVGVAGDGSTFINFYPVATYIGASPSATFDSFTVDLLASISVAPLTGDFDGLYTEHIPLVVAANSFAQGQLLVSTNEDPALQGIGLIGHNGPGTWDESASRTLTGLNGDTLFYDYHFSFSFDSGALTGACDASPASGSPVCGSVSATPEPASMIPAALSLIGFGLVALRRRK